MNRPTHNCVGLISIHYIQQLMDDLIPVNTNYSSPKDLFGISIDQYLDKAFCLPTFLGTPNSRHFSIFDKNVF